MTHAPHSPDWLASACAFIEAEETVPSLERLAKELGLSPAHVQRTFASALGVSPRSYGDAVRQARFKTSLRAGEDISGALYGAGFGSSSRVYEFAKRHFGMTPKDYKNGGKGREILYTTVPTELGALLLAATPLGLCSVRLGDDGNSLIAELRAEFFAANLIEGNEALADWAGLLVEYLAGDAAWPLLPYDIAATAFQRRVWEWLRTVPPGQTFSYSESAVELGFPKAVRALASACARNPVALIIPCHRIVPKGGGVGQYRWDAARKQKLLELEGAIG